MTAFTHPLTIPQLEQVYDTLAQAIDQAGPDHSEVFLTKLSLLMANALGDPALVATLVDAALKDLQGA
jgi:hypothetical protein